MIEHERVLILLFRKLLVFDIRIMFLYLSTRSAFQFVRISVDRQQVVFFNCTLKLNRKSIWQSEFRLCNFWS
jgi:hypothetical protein